MRSDYATPQVSEKESMCASCALFGFILAAITAGSVAAVVLHTRVVIDRAEFMCVERATVDDAKACVKWVRRAN